MRKTPPNNTSDTVGIPSARGLGSTICSLLELKEVRAKTDMSTGDPTEFYLKNCFVPVRKEGNIIILEKRRRAA